MTGTTDDRNDPGLGQVDSDTGLQASYLVLSDEERAQGFVRPVRRTYVHQTCGTATTMSLAIAETYARQPGFYGGTYCAGCRDHFPVGEHGQFVWDGTDQKVGS
ncbi:hypothetical protein [Nocardioides sp. AX2bis]|uniref:hypothetical protein n=1 Tax=Nocardioides sp. AX2bis TaxID=2653157 RepID=UPI0012EEF9D8|nr:hypothetical protein [Nocardioides sp. AX2bis]VXC42792.1 hypothetical protein NOCARDAX2BIS_540003 [Nocardioides sp. AX2bis]